MKTKAGTFMKKWIFIMMGVLALIGWQLYMLYSGIVDGQAQKFAKAATTAQQRYDLKDVIDVTYYHGTVSYEVVKALNQHDETIFIWFPEDGEPFFKRASEGMNKSEVKQYALKTLNTKELIDIRLGAENNFPFWEITYIDENDRYTFYYLSFDGDHWVKTIRL